MMGNLADFLQILCQPGDGMTGLIVVIIAEAQALHMLKKLAAHIGLDIYSEHMTPIGDHKMQTGIDCVYRHQSDAGPDNERPVSIRQESVDYLIDREWEGKLEQPNQYSAGKVQDKQPFVWLIVRKKTSQHAFPSFFYVVFFYIVPVSPVF
jgi:hypothetical protein